MIASLKDNFSGHHVRVPGAAKVLCHPGFGLAAVAADSLLRHRREVVMPA